jgi:hypothetical protein
MSRQLDYRSTSSHPADEVYAAMVDPEYLHARLAEIGGPGADLLEHDADADGARYVVRHGLDAKDLPSVVRSMLPGTLVIERTEAWRRQQAGGYAGDVTVTIEGTPASAVGGMRLQDINGGSELAIRATVTVNVPLIGGKIETVVAEQVQALLAAEAAYTEKWLNKAL